MSNSNACAGARTHWRLRHRVVVETDEQAMTKSFALGRAIFATAMAALGAQRLIADEWTSMRIALALCGSALLIASSLPPVQAA